MAEILGREAIIAFDVKAGSSFGTATACTKRLGVDNFEGPLNPQRLFSSPVGRDESMLPNILRGAIDPQVSFAGKVGFNNGFPELFATFFGTAGVPSEITGGQGDYLHQLIFNPSRQGNILTMAKSSTSTEIKEWTDVILQSIGLNFSGPFAAYVEATLEGLASNRVDIAASQVNSLAGLQALAVPPRDEIIATNSSEFRLNAQGGGALGSGDVVPVTSVQVNYVDPLELTSEMKGSAGNSQPGSTDLFACQLTVTFRALEDMTYFIAAANETEFKAEILVEGEQIGSGVNKRFNPKFPRLKIIDDIQAGVSSAGRNPYTVVFDALIASANPTGMDSVYPYIDIVSELATDLLA